MKENEVFVLTGKDPFYHKMMVLGVYKDIATLREEKDTTFVNAGYTEFDFGSFEIEQIGR